MNPVQQTVNAAKRHLGFRLIELGQRLGFSVQTVEGVLEDPSERLLTDMLHSLPKEIFNLNGAIPEALSVPFTEYLSNSTIVAHTTSRPSVTTVGIGAPLSQRCGRRCGGPLNDADRLHLFLRKMHAPLSDFPRDGYDVSSFYVKRSIYLAFFGTTNIPLTMEPPAPDDIREESVEIPTNDVPNAAEPPTRDDTREESVEVPTNDVLNDAEPPLAEFHEGLRRGAGFENRVPQDSELPPQVLFHLFATMMRDG